MVLKLLYDIDISLTTFEYSYSLVFIDEVLKSHCIIISVPSYPQGISVEHEQEQERDNEYCPQLPSYELNVN
jgi:hypothetical protein